jgi:predicted RNA-binding protein with PIN domain
MTDPPEETFLIDGYNFLLRSFRFLEAQHGLEAARAKLEVRLREFLRASGQRVRVVLVYDGAKGFGRASLGEYPAGGPSGGGLEVVFSLPPRTADEHILDACKRWKGPGTLTVVTSDLKDIAGRVRGPGLRHATSEEFAEMLDEALKRPRAPAEEEPPESSSGREKPSPEEITPQEADDWLRIFSEPKPPRGRRRGSGAADRRPPSDQGP